MPRITLKYILNSNKYVKISKGAQNFAKLSLSLQSGRNKNKIATLTVAFYFLRIKMEVFSFKIKQPPRKKAVTLSMSTCEETSIFTSTLTR